MRSDLPFWKRFREFYDGGGESPEGLETLEGASLEGATNVESVLVTLARLHIANRVADINGANDKLWCSRKPRFRTREDYERQKLEARRSLSGMRHLHHLHDDPIKLAGGDVSKVRDIWSLVLKRFLNGVGPQCLSPDEVSGALAMGMKDWRGVLIGATAKPYRDMEFDRCLLGGMVVNDAVLSGVRFIDCDWETANPFPNGYNVSGLTAPHPEHTVRDGNTIPTATVFARARLWKCVFKDANMGPVSLGAGTTINNSHFSDVNFAGCYVDPTVEFSGNRFTGCSFNEVEPKLGPSNTFERSIVYQ